MSVVGFCISIVALVISFCSAYYARRATTVAEQKVAIERDREREDWVLALIAALPDPRRVEALLGDLPDRLKPDWESLVRSALRRNSRTPEAVADQLLAKRLASWGRAALGHGAAKG